MLRRASFLALVVVTLLTPGFAHAAKGKKPAPEIVAPTEAQVRRALGDTPPRAAVIYDLARGQVLWARRAHEQRSPASLLKMATALVVAERLNPTDEVVISGLAASAAHDQLQWRRGARFTVEDVMHGMMLSSSNGAATALAERTAGSLEAFRKLANKRLRAWGLKDTTLVDPSGLDAIGQVSTARDLARMAGRVLRDPWLATIVRTPSYTLPWPDGGEATFYNLNRYLSVDPTAVGVKNGFTSGAGNALAAASTRDGRTHVVIVLDAGDPYDVAARLMDLAFDIAPGFRQAAKRAAREAAEPEPEASVLGITATRAPEGEAATVAVGPPPLVTSAGSVGAMTKLFMAFPVAAWGSRLLQVEYRRSLRRRAVRKRIKRRS